MQDATIYGRESSSEDGLRRESARMAMRAAPACSAEYEEAHASFFDGGKPNRFRGRETRQLPFYAAWLAAVMKAVDKAFDGDADVVELVGLVGDDDEVASHREMAALMADLEEAYKAGKMGGGSYRQLSAARIAHAAVASKLSKLEDDSHAVVVWCAAPKRDGVAKKLAKYNEKSGDRIGVAWAD